MHKYLSGRRSNLATMLIIGLVGLIVWLVVIPLIQALGKVAKGVGSIGGVVGDVATGVSDTLGYWGAVVGITKNPNAATIQNVRTPPITSYWHPDWWSNKDTPGGVSIPVADINNILQELKDSAEWMGYDTDKVIHIMDKFQTKYNISYAQFMAADSDILTTPFSGSGVRIPQYFLNGLWCRMSDGEFTKVITHCNAFPDV